MKLQDQVTSAYLSLKLRELGLVHPSLFYREWSGAKDSEIEFQGQDGDGMWAEDGVNCYTASELGELLPKGVGSRKTVTSYSCYFNPEYLSSDWKKTNVNPPPTKDINEANARAKMLIYLLENKLVNS